ncbi:MAG: 4-diphosphocytidyl-2C-methyl-D-erythritol kinase, partial [Alphaproteobacteria bacterium]
MKFGDIATDDAEGAILVHRHRVGERSFKKGRQLTKADLEQLRQAGIESVIAVRLEPDDIGEDEAASRVAAALTGAGLTASAAFTGRVNLYAEAAGVAKIDFAALHRANAVDEAVTIATIAPYDVVKPKQMVATVKIIP